MHLFLLQQPYQKLFAFYCLAKFESKRKMGSRFLFVACDCPHMSCFTVWTLTWHWDKDYKPYTDSSLRFNGSEKIEPYKLFGLYIFHCTFRVAIGQISMNKTSEVKTQSKYQLLLEPFLLFLNSINVLFTSPFFVQLWIWYVHFICSLRAFILAHWALISVVAMEECVAWIIHFLLPPGEFERWS